MNNKLFISAALVLGIVVLVNLLAGEFKLRFDFTEDKQYTLSTATEDILKDLEEPVTIKAYFSQNVTPQIANIRRDFKEMLIEYASIADGMLVYEFIDPVEEEQQQEAMQNGISPQMINVREQNEIKMQQAFFGAIVSLGEQREIIPAIQPGAAMEYALSTSIKKLSVVNKPTIGILQGHGEPSSQELLQAAMQLNILYNIQDVSITEGTPIPANIKTLAIVAPSDSFPDTHLNALDAYMANGGNLLVAINRVNGDLQTSQGTSMTTGLETWLRNKGVSVEENFVVDAQCASVTVQQQRGFFNMQSQVQFPYLPIISTFADHPITKGLEAVILEFASTINYIGDSTATFTPIAFTSEKSGFQAAPQFFDVQKQWTEADLPQQNLTIAGILESNTTPGKVVVISDGDFAVNRDNRQSKQPDNINLMVNSIDWLSDDTGLIDLRTKGVTSRPIEEMEDSRKNFLKYLNFALPIALVVLYGVIRTQMRRRQRNKRMQESYA